MAYDDLNLKLESKQIAIADIQSDLDSLAVCPAQGHYKVVVKWYTRAL